MESIETSQSQYNTGSPICQMEHKLTQCPIKAQSHKSRLNFKQNFKISYSANPKKKKRISLRPRNKRPERNGGLL